MSGVAAEGADQPPQVEVCQVRPARAGEPVTFELKASDADSGIRDDCGSPKATYGDASETAICLIGCESLPPGPDQLHRRFEHVYAEPGTYGATFTLVGCGPDDPITSVSLPVTVTT